MEVTQSSTTDINSPPTQEEVQNRGSPKQSPPSVSPPPPRKKRRVLLWILLLLIGGAIFYFALQYRGGAQTTAGPSRRLMGPVTITVATVKKGNIGVYLEAIGTVTPVYTSSITAQVNGLVTAVNYREGEMVQKGDSLIEINPGIYQAQVVQAQGALERDTSLLAQAKMDLDRYRAAWARNGIPKQTLDDQEKLVLQLEGTVKNDQGTLQFDLVELGYCHITAPITGRVGLRLLDPGNVVQANPAVSQSSTTSSALVVITQIQPITVIFTLAEDNLNEVRTQMGRGVSLPVQAFDRALETRIASGKLLTLDNQIDTTTGTVKARAVFDNKDSALFPNQFVNTRLLVKTLRGVTLVPTNAIQHNGPTAFVYVIQNGTANVKTITPGVTDSGMTAVEGLNPGDVVATSSFNNLQNGVKVVVSKTAIPANPTETSTP
ncbi:MAG: putative Co/Zn/Cd efflux system rane fusion protein [Bryobacterales bacterium]|nr:putative Co/Zn/Cd efflux system rane fusion protein [Bryobacterales bacterium]